MKEDLIKRRYGKEWENMVKEGKILTLNVPDTSAYWTYQILTTFWECEFDKLSKNDRKYLGEFIRILKSKLKLRTMHL